MIPFSSAFRPLRILLALLRRPPTGPAAWLPWLGAALLVAAAFSPGNVTASRLAFQSPLTETPTSSASPTPVQPTQTPVHPQPAVDTPTPPPPEPTSTEAVPAEATVESPPTEATPTQESIPATGQPTEAEPSPPSEPTQAPAAPPGATSPAQAPEALEASPPQEPEQPPSAEANQPIINWVKFWDTMAVLVAYPWLCCGVGLLLLVPVVLLFLEIRGRRPPPMPPEQWPAEKKGNEE